MAIRLIISYMKPQDMFTKYGYLLSSSFSIFNAKFYSFFMFFPHLEWPF